jgi:hypothetical protein
MANSHSSISVFKYFIKHVYLSVIMTLGLMVYSYWDIIKLRYSSGFFDSAEVSTGSQELFLAGFKNSLSTVVSDSLPIVVTLLFASLVAYTLYNSYENTVYDLDVNANYVNAQKVHTLRIVIHYVTIYTASFVLPLLFWSTYLTYIFPTIAKIPLSYIFGYSTLHLSIVAACVLLGLIVITQLGLILTRLTIKILSKR